LYDVWFRDEFDKLFDHPSYLQRLRSCMLRGVVHTKRFRSLCWSVSHFVICSFRHCFISWFYDCFICVILLHSFSVQILSLHSDCQLFGDSLLHNFMHCISVSYFEAQVLVPGASNNLSQWVIEWTCDFSPWAS